MFYHEFVKNRTSISGLYRITNTLNGKFYIGKAADIFKRWGEHITKDKKFAIHDAIAKYGVEVFNFEILVKCPDTEYLTTLEESAIRAYDCVAPNGYNLTYGGEGGKQILECAVTKAKHTASVQSASNRAKISESMKVVCADKEFLNARSAAVTEALNKPETIAKLSAASKAMWESSEYRDKFTASMRKVMDSDEYKEKIARTSKIHRNTPEALQRTSELSKAKWADPVHRIKVCFSRYPSKATPDFETGWRRCISKGISEDFRKFAMDLCASRLHKLA